MIFEIANNFVENLLISFFIIEYINAKKYKLHFIITTVITNTFLSTLLSHLNVIGITQTLTIQFILCISLYKYHENFSFQDIVVSFYCNILLFISVYFSIIFLSFTYRLSPFQIYNATDIYISFVIISKIIFLFMIIFSIKTKPLLFTKTKIKELNYLLAIELLIIMIMAYYFLTSILDRNYNYSSTIIFICFILLFFSFCYIFNRIIYMSQLIYETKLKEDHMNYKKENLKNLNTIKFHIDNTEHRINYILQSIEFDLKEQRYDKALNKINISKELVHKIAPVLCTNNELFDFILNLEIKFFMQNKKDIKVCAFISQNNAYDNLDLINHIIGILKLLYKYVNKIELFLTEKDLNLLEVRLIVHHSEQISCQILKKQIYNIFVTDININKNKDILILNYEEKLNEYL